MAGSSPAMTTEGAHQATLPLTFYCFAHDLIRKPVPIPDQIGDRLFRDHARALGLADTASRQRCRLSKPSGIATRAGFMKSTAQSAVISATV